MEWVRGDQLGYGSFAKINIAIPTNPIDQFPPLMAVKSTEVVFSDSLKNEKQVLDQIGPCPHIITCFGDCYTIERDGNEYYNLLLEYAKGGSLADELNNHGGGLPESDVQRYTSAILHGLDHIHSNGFVHCDIKLSNILLFDNGQAKIADFGLSKMAGKNRAKTELSKFELRGTPLYLSPESVNENEYEPPCDIWALGCTVVEMITGKSAWNVQSGSNVYALLIRIGAGEEIPKLPENLSNEGKDFLEKCFVKDPNTRSTARMLLNHPFVSGTGVGDSVTLKQTEKSPKGPFEFTEFASQSDDFSVKSYFSSSNISPPAIFSNSAFDFVASAKSRLEQLVSSKGLELDWSVSDSWMTVR